jgi:hypothetical protein
LYADFIAFDFASERSVKIIGLTGVLGLLGSSLLFPLLFFFSPEDWSPRSLRLSPSIELEMEVVACRLGSKAGDGGDKQTESGCLTEYPAFLNIRCSSTSEYASESQQLRPTTLTDKAKRDLGTYGPCRAEKADTLITWCDARKRFPRFSSRSTIQPWASSLGSKRCVIVISESTRMRTGIHLQKEPEDFGQILAALALDVQKRETRLNEIRLRERRATLLVTLYTLAGWGAYLGLWYAQVLPQASKHRINSPVDKAIKAFPAVLGPIMYVILPQRTPHAYMMASRILFTRRIVQLWYNRKGNAEGQSVMLHWPRLSLVFTLSSPTFFLFLREGPRSAEACATQQGRRD